MILRRFSSHVPTNGTSFTTFQMEMDHYTGNVRVQGAQNYESVWADVTNVQSYYNKSGADYINVLGYHPLLRLVSDQWPGTEQVQLATGHSHRSQRGDHRNHCDSSRIWISCHLPRSVSLDWVQVPWPKQKLPVDQVSAINVIDGGIRVCCSNPQQTNQVAVIGISRGAIISILVR